MTVSNCIESSSPDCHLSARAEHRTQQHQDTFWEAAQWLPHTCPAGYHREHGWWGRHCQPLSGAPKHAELKLYWLTDYIKETEDKKKKVLFGFKTNVAKNANHNLRTEALTCWNNSEIILPLINIAKNWESKFRVDANVNIVINRTLRYFSLPSFQSTFYFDWDNSGGKKEESLLEKVVHTYMNICRMNLRCTQ